MKKIILASIIGLLISTGCGDPKVRTPEKIPDGLKTTYNKYAKMTIKSQYKNGKRNGLTTKYYYKKKREQTTYVNGKKEGVEKKWSLDGILTHLRYYKNNKMEGINKAWHLSGKLWYIEDRYYAGKLHGTIKTYYENGRSESISNWTNGKKNGTEKYYYENGGLKFTKMWVNGEDKGTKFSTREKREAAAIEKEYAQIMAKKNKTAALASSGSISTPSLNCMGDNSQPSMSEYSSKMAISKGKGEGAALGYQIKGGTSTSRRQANSYCVQVANTSGLACPYAKAYLSGCISKFGY